MDPIFQCPVCGRKLESKKCTCGYEIREKEGVLIFPSRIVDLFTGYTQHTGLEAYTKESSQEPSVYYPRYIDDHARIILDVGGGDGHALANFARDNPDSIIYVVDADYTSIRKVPKRGLPNLKPLCVTATNLPFQDGSVDVVFTLFMVEHMYDYQYSDFLFSARRVLKPGGKLIIATDGDVYDKWIHPLFKFRTSGFLDKWDAMKISIDHHNLKSPYQAARFVERHGFFVQDIRLHLFGGRRLPLKLFYELLPKIIVQKLFATMYVLIARKGGECFQATG